MGWNGWKYLLVHNSFLESSTLTCTEYFDYVHYTYVNVEIYKYIQNVFFFRTLRNPGKPKFGPHFGFRHGKLYLKLPS